jgi:hypothetical protein
VDGHHVKHWAHGGETKLANLVTLCRFHHRQVHEGQVVVQILDDGAFRFTRPDGESFESPTPRMTDWQELVAMHQAEKIRITPTTAITAWTGETLDYSLAAGCLMERAQQARNVPTGTSLSPSALRAP